MNQTEFGNKIAELRKKKGLTQAELAEKCNLNIRSIQRIESGKVVPRAYTFKMLSEILDSELTSPETDKLNVAKRFGTKVIEVLTASKKNKKYGARDMERKLKYSWMSGIIMFAVLIPESLLDIARYNNDLSASDTPLYIIISIISMVTFIIFMNGYILIGTSLRNNILIICTYLFIICTVIEYGIDFLTIGNSQGEQKAIGAIFSVTYGFIGLFFGIGLLRTVDIFGKTAKYAAILNIVAGVTFILVVLFFIGLVLLVPIIILQILIVHRAATKLDWIPENAAVA